MKSFIDKFFLLAIPFVLWIFCFRYFFNGHLHLEADAVPYAQQINFYTDNLSKGVFPLWGPNTVMIKGVPYDFFLRRMGDVNPFFFLIVLLKWFCVPSAAAYLIFLGVYYFLAGWAFYLITRFLLQDHFFAFTAYILLLFSSWGAEVFYNYIIIIFVPIIWFFYFLLCFSRTPQKRYFLGMCFCTGLILTTYIPFFFLTILTIFTFFHILFYRQVFISFLKTSVSFLFKNKIFVFSCVIFLLVSCIPGLIFYKESKSGEFVLPQRHAGADSSSAVAVGVSNADNGDIISHGYFDRLFDDHANIDMGDIYVPYIFFILLLITIPAKINKLIFFLLFNILALSLITITSSGKVHHFLYEHVIIFKFIRQLYYFFWLSMLPMAILLSVACFKSLLTAINSSSKKNLWLFYIVISHLAFIVFLCGHRGVLWGAWAAVFISLLYFLAYFIYDNKISYPLGFCLLLLAVFIQSSQLYSWMDKKLLKSQAEARNYEQAHSIDDNSMRLELYYTTRWFQVLIDYVDPYVLNEYRGQGHQFILYDNVIPYVESVPFFRKFEKTLSSNTNVAYVSKNESGPDDWKIDPDAVPQADIDPVHSGKLSIVRSDVNTWVLRTHLAKSQFLVINDNYTKDWHAFINGHQARLLRADVSFKGLWVPAGESNILLRFSTPKSYLFHIVLIFLYLGTFIYFFVLLKKETGAERSA